MAAVVGLIAARRGLRTIVAEVAARDDVTRALEAASPGRYAEREIAPGLHHISIDPEAALEEYLRDQLPAPLAELLAQSRMFTVLAAATPGMRELLSIGKVWELAQAARRQPGAEPYDLVVLDAPATGHGVAILEAPRTFAGAARVGSVARQGRTIHAMLSDPARTAVVAVTTPEELPVNETLAFRDAVRGQLGGDLALVVVNGVRPDRFTEGEADALRADGSAAARVALAAHERARAQRGQIARLKRALDGAVPTIRVPFTPTGADLDLIADRLERAL